MLNESTRRDAIHLGILNSYGQAFEDWHNAQVEVIHRRMIRRHPRNARVLAQPCQWARRDPWRRKP